MMNYPDHPLFARLVENPEVSLGKRQGRPVRHVLDKKSVYAVYTALRCGRPLLVRGRPGTGKSQLAEAAAEVLQRPFVKAFVDARTEARDLMWSYDAVARLAEAQVPADGGGDEIGSNARLSPSRFVAPGPLWWAYNYASADLHANRSDLAIPVDRPKLQRPPDEDGKDQPPRDPKRGLVVLLDEIDKGDSSLLGGLLEALGRFELHPPGFHGGIKADDDDRRPTPLVVLTSNDERELPAAFVRRCVVLPLAAPDDRDELIKWLVVRGRAHLTKDERAASTKEKDKLLRAAAKRVAEARVEDELAEYGGPGLAEYIDLLHVLLALPSEQRDSQLKEVAPYLLYKDASPR